MGRQRAKRAGTDARAHDAKRGVGQGKAMARARTVTLTCMLVAVIVSLAFDTGLGTPSSFGIGTFFLLCPLGGIEAMVASASFIPVSAISLAVVLVLSLVFGRAWCAWGCPAPAIRRFFKRDPKPQRRSQTAARRRDGDGAGRGDGCGADDAQAGTDDTATCGAWSVASALRHIVRDTRSWSLAIVLVAVAIAGLPLFCLICPIGLTFGTVSSLWHLFVDKQVTMSVLVFPAALVAELVVCRTWCVNLCPVGGLLGIVGQFARRFRPHVNADTCITRSAAGSCDRCMTACSERIDLHAQDAAVQLGECTRCGECARSCPTGSITFRL